MVTSSSLETRPIITVSSAYLTITCLDKLLQSDVYIIKSTADRTQPWGAPVLISITSDKLPSKHCSTGTIPAQYRGYCRNGTGPPLFYCHLRNSDLPFCTSAFYRSGTGKLLPYRYQPAQLHYIASIIYVGAWCWVSTSPVQNLLWACHWPRTIQPVSG